MKNLNDVETMFLKLLGVDFKEEIGKDLYEASDGEIFIKMDDDELLAFPTLKFHSKDTDLVLCIDFINRSEIEVCRGTYRYCLEENKTDDGDIRYFSIKVTDLNDDRDFEITTEPDYCSEGETLIKTTLIDSYDLYDECYVKCNLNTVQGIDTRERDIIVEYEFSDENYKKALIDMTNNMYYDEIKEIFIKMMPLLYLVYDKLTKMSQSFVDKLAQEREEINQEADREIARINKQRDKKLQENNRVLKKYLSRIKK